MRQVKTLALMIAAALMLASCSSSGGSAKDQAMKAREQFTAADGQLEITAEVKADYGDRAYEYKLKYTGTADNGEVDVLLPESVAGIKAMVSVSGGTISYDGPQLDTGPLTDSGLTPVGAIPLLIAQWRNGYMTGCNYEKLGETNALTVTTDVSKTIVQRTWFDVKTLLPVRSELSENGRMVVACNFENIIME